MLRCYAVLLIATFISFWGCSKKETGVISAALMKSDTVSTALHAHQNGQLLTTATGSSAQSFTPASLKLAIYRVSLCEGNGNCQSVYTCAANTVEGCGVELSKIDAFVDTLNAAGKSIEEGKKFDHIAVQFCPDGDSSGIQNVTVNGKVSINGVSYGTHPTEGLVAGADGKDTPIGIKGGCASFYPFPSVTVSEGETIKVKLFFDASLYTYGGIAGGSASQYDYRSSDSCAGSSAAYVCASVITIVATVDSGNPSTEHYLVADTTTSTGGSETSAPTAKITLYYSSAGDPIGGIQNDFRISGADVSWGQRMGGGLGLYPKTVDASTVSIGEPGGSIQLANWFKNFKRATHTGKYLYQMNGAEIEGDYKATRL